MSSSFSNDNKRKSSRECSEASIQKKREIDKIRRQRQSAKKETIETPVFPQPRKITARQDSLARNITNVLGDSEVVSPLLFREPSNWFGTSRSGKGHIVRKGQEKSSVSSTSISKGIVVDTHGNKLKSYVEEDHLETEQEGTPSIQTTALRFSGQQCDLLRGEPFDRGHLSQSKSDHICSKQHSLRSQPNTLQSHNSQREKSASSLHITTVMERDRASSVDSDVIGGVENILKEMVVDLSPSITGINTPSVSDSKFTFSPYTQAKRLEHPEATLQRTSVNRRDLNDSDDSSDDETSDDDSDDDRGAVNSGWDLVDLMPRDVPVGERLQDTISEEPKEMVYEKSHSERGPRHIINNYTKANCFPSLLVRLSTTIALNSRNGLSGNGVSEVGFSQNSPTAVYFTQRNNRDIGAVSTGSETEQPVRRTNCVQVAVADGSTDWQADISGKRGSDFPHVAQNDLTKRQKREKCVKKRNQSNADGEWQLPVESKPCHGPSSPTTGQPSSSQSGHGCSITNKKPATAVASVVLPDSSVPAEQERIHSPDWYMREGKRMKHEGDSMVDSRTGRTRSGETLNRALSYFEASLFFIMSGYVMESENDRLDVGSSHNSSSTSHCPTNMYQQTLPLLEFVLKMHPRAEQQDRTFERITLSCLRCQSFLYFRIFKLKKDAALKYSEILTEQFKTMGKSSQTHSPWRGTNVAPNVLSPMSPAVPSPFTHRGPSPASSNGEQVSSSTQTGRMTPTAHSNYNFSQKMYDIYRQNHAIMRSLLQAHEKWDQGEQLFEEHADFFRNIDALCNRTITFHSGLRDVFIYYGTVLHQLRALMNGSPTT